MNFNAQKIIQLFKTKNNNCTNDLFLKLYKNHEIPPLKPNKKSWSLDQIPEIGKKIGFLTPPKKTQVLSFFVTKGGVLKTSLAYNLARLSALNGFKVLVVGLDMQADITTSFGYPHQNENDNFSDQLKICQNIRGLPDLYFSKLDLNDIIISSDIPGLDFIPETPELISLEQALHLRHRREEWLQQNVVAPATGIYDLIIFDAPPSWNLLITNALQSSNILISPLECKINNFRNAIMFQGLIQNFKKDLNLEFTQKFIPTKLNFQRRLSRDIFEWYLQNISECLPYAVKESVLGEEASALNISVNELQPESEIAKTYKQILEDLFLNHSSKENYKKSFKTLQLPLNKHQKDTHL